VTYERLVEIYWRTIDPLDKGGQFCDRGSQYRPEIFAVDDGQKQIAEASRQRLIDEKRFRQPIVVAVTTGQRFWKAEDYHQNFYKTNPVRYYTYRAGCGRDARLEALWGKEAGGKLLLTQ
jgi:peptide-methionine (S)-S-oxide reductase